MAHSWIASFWLAVLPLFFLPALAGPAAGTAPDGDAEFQSVCRRYVAYRTAQYEDLDHADELRQEFLSAATEQLERFPGHGGESFLLATLAWEAYGDDDHDGASRYALQLMERYEGGAYGSASQTRRVLGEVEGAFPFRSPDAYYLEAVHVFLRDQLRKEEWERMEEVRRSTKRLLSSCPEGSEADVAAILLFLGQASVHGGDTTEARRLYGDLMRRFPGTDDAARAKLALAAMDAAGGGTFRVVQTSYTGKYTSSGEVKAAQRELPRAHEASLAVVARTLGLHPLPDRPYSIALADTEEGMTGAWAVTITDRVLAQQMPVIKLFTEGIAEENYDWKKTLTHELVHALMHANMGEGYHALPSWVKEGLAVYGAEQGPERVAETLSGHLSVSLAEHVELDFSDLVDGLEDDQRQGGFDYAENYLAFDALRQKVGPEGFLRCVGELFAGTPHEKVLGEAFDRSMGAFRKAAKEHARSVYGAAVEPHRELLRAAFENRVELGYFAPWDYREITIDVEDHRGEEENERALRDYEAALRKAQKAAPKGAYFLANLDFELAKVAGARERYGDAARRGLEVARRFSQESIVGSEAVFLAGCSYLNMNRKGEALQCFRRVWRDYPGFPWSGTAREVYDVLSR